MPHDPFRDALILTGPTASGKSALALDLAARLDAEIVAMDSMTLYRGLDVGTAKPTRAERDRVPHHLIDVLDPWESANVAWWLEHAAAACRDIVARGKLPLIVGGTPFYLKGLLAGLFPSPPADRELRSRLEADAERDGPAALHARLAAVDPVAAARIHPNNVRRVVRALEVHQLTGRPISEWQTQWGPRAAEPAAVPRCLWLDVPRDELYARINSRVRSMMEGGWIDEVRRLRALPRPLSKEASQALGYREVAEYLDRGGDLEATIDRIQTLSRQFAKRQLTWFRHLPDCIPADAKLTFAVWHPRILKNPRKGCTPGGDGSPSV
jgi:tRNA dimethylallyltransferase